MIVYTSCKGAARWLSGLLGDPGAYTIGSFVFSTQNAIEADVLRHEGGHVEQYDLLGAFFLPVDAISTVASAIVCGDTSNRCNPIEQDADRRAGTDLY